MDPRISHIMGQDLLGPIDSEEMAFLRHRLRQLASFRLVSPHTPAEEAEYSRLCELERTLQAAL